MTKAEAARQNGKLGGRPKGSTTRPQISDYITVEEVEQLVEMAKTQAKERPELLKFLLEQVFGRAKQSMDLTGELTNTNIGLDEKKYNELIKLEYERLNH